jgi:hypothetical protein
MSEISTAIVAYWGDTNEIAYIEGDPDYGADRIFDAMQRFVCDGHVTEVLEVIHAPNASIQAGERCKVWSEHLTKLGYETE